MKKVLGVTGAIVVLGLVLLPYWVGTGVESAMKEQIDITNSASQGYYQVELVEYDRGFSEATAKTDLILDLSTWKPDAGLEPVRIRFSHKIEHGPLVNVRGQLRGGAGFIKTTLDQSNLPAATQAMIATFLTTPEQPFLSEDFISFHGDVESEFRVSGVKHQDIEESLDFAGVNGWVKGNLVQNQYQGELTLGEFKFVNLEQLVSVDGGSLDMNFQLYGDSLWLGNQSLEINNVIYEKQGAELASVGAVSFSGGIEESAGKVSSNSTISVNDVTSVFPFLTDAKLSMGLNGVPVSAVEKAQVIMAELQSAMPTDPTNQAAQSAYGMMFMQRVSELVNLYVQKGTQFEVGVDLKNTDGQAKADLQIGFDGVQNNDLMAAFAENTEALLAAFNGELSISVDQSALSVVPVQQYVDMALQSGFVKEEGFQWVSNIQLKDALLKVNGMLEIPLMNLLQGAMAQKQDAN